VEIQQSAGIPEPIHSIENLWVPTAEVDVPIRVYRPHESAELAVLMYFFGGGWTLGNLETGDAVCRYLARRGGFAVVAVQYRLAPENKFPAALHDCYAATQWVAEHGTRLGLDRHRLAVAGDSAGGNLAATVALLARDKGSPRVAFQALIYPVTDYMADTESMRSHDDPYLFNRRSMQWYWGHYLPSPHAVVPYAAPLQAPDLSGLPPSLIITAEYDPLRDEAEIYARRLIESGGAVELTRFEGMAHGFFTMLGDLDQARTAANQVADRLRETLHHLT